MLYSDDDYMEFGEGLVSLPDGWYLDTNTGNKIDPDGRIFNENGDLLYDDGEEDYER